ncbi:multidrug efflux SMR transporter [Bacillus sp. FJAT-47783]|uniref:DMT family transporter n=1 Tax=Bacillus sp. FJAT-47783 TaxID=2922712 RepID=UPI001FAE6295|nr:multidrug efflux SMR transporter [Bacillus sp. FJAT-47783]
MAWISLITAGLFEVVGVMGITLMNKRGGIFSFFVLFIGFLCSFSLLNVAMSSISMGTAYAVWTGIGTIGSAVVGIVFFKEPADKKRLFFISLVILSVIGLKMYA